jgi:uncharacterized protein YbjT (DUF2867 family)
MGNKTAIVIGGTGLVGTELIKILLQDDYYATIIAISRKPVDIMNDRLVQYVIDFEKLNDYKELISANDVYCCLGTTMKVAGSKENFHKIDFGYTVQIAKIVAGNKAEQFILVSSMGANKNSSVYYNKVKGEIEEEIKKLPFTSTIIVRPSLLLGQRKEKRSGEDAAKKISKTFSFAMAGPLKKYKPVQASAVARSMFGYAKKQMKGVHVFTSDKLHEMKEKLQAVLL